MNIDTLREFATLAIVKSYSESARQLNVSQPTLSRHIASLEAELGCSLLNRTTPLSLTRAGEQILEDVQVMLSAYDSMVETARVAKRSPQRVISIQDYSFSARAFNHISTCERSFERDNPGVSFKNIECTPGQTVAQMIEGGLLDMGFVHTFDDGSELQLPETPEGVEAMCIPSLCGSLAFVYHRDRALAAKARAGELAKLADFGSARFLSPTEHYLEPFRQSFSQFCELYGGFKPKFDFRPMHSHKYFYALDPGESAYISWSFRGKDSISAANRELASTVLEQYRFNTYVLFAKDRQDQLAESFAKLLSLAPQSSE